MPQDEDGFRFGFQPTMLLELIRTHYRGDPKLKLLLDDIEPFVFDRDVELEDFLTNAPAVPSTGYDATVIAGASTDSATRTYGSVFRAMEALDALGFATARIALISRGGVVTETSVLGTLTTLRSVEIASTDGGDDVNDWSSWARWNHGGFSTAGTTGTTFKWELTNIAVEIGGSKAAFFQDAAITVEAYNVVFDGSGAATSTTAPLIAATTGMVHLSNCSMREVDPSNTIDFGGVWQWSVVATLGVGGSIIHFGTLYQWSGATALNCTVSGSTIGATRAIHMIGVEFGRDGPFGSGSSGTLTITTSGANHSVVITGAGDRSGYTGTGMLALNISNYSQCYVDVQAEAITIGAPSTGNTSTSAAKCFVGGTVWGAADLTGPCQVAISCGQLTVRGKGVGGTASIGVVGSATVALTGVAVTDSALVVTAGLHPQQASSTQKSFAFDAASVRSVVIFAGKNNFPTPGTNGGTVTIIDEDGAPSNGAGSGDFTIGTVTKGLRIKEGSNARLGTATLVAGTVTVANTTITAATRILLTVQALGTVAVPKAVAAVSRVNGTSFTITSADATDTSVVAWMLVEGV